MEFKGRESKGITAGTKRAKRSQEKREEATSTELQSSTWENGSGKPNSTLCPGLLGVKMSLPASQESLQSEPSQAGHPGAALGLWRSITDPMQRAGVAEGGQVLEAG